MAKLFTSITVVALASLSARASAQEFGKQRQLVISSDAAVSITSSASSYAGQSLGSTTAVRVAPAVDYFLADAFSLGAALLFAWQSMPGSFSSGTTTTTSFGGGPRVGYDLNLGERFSVWPRANLMFSRASASSDVADTSSLVITVGLYVPLLVFPTPHFFLGFGPFVQTDLQNRETAALKQPPPPGSSAGPPASDGPTRTTYGVQLTVGGWFSP